MDAAFNRSRTDIAEASVRQASAASIVGQAAANSSSARPNPPKPLPMKYSLRSLMIVALVAPPLLALAIVFVPRILAWLRPPPPQEKHTIMFIKTDSGEVVPASSAPAPNPPKD